MLTFHFNSERQSSVGRDPACSGRRRIGAIKLSKSIDGELNLKRLISMHAMKHTDYRKLANRWVDEASI